MKISAEQLKSYRRVYTKQYDGLSKNQVVRKFMENLKKYLDYELRKEVGGFYKYLVGLAKVGMAGVDIYHGYIPMGYEVILLPNIQLFLIDYFRLSSFSGFGLQFKG